MKGTLGIKLRRQDAQNRLETQLKQGTKPEKINGKTSLNTVELTDFDKKRIIKELDILTKYLNKSIK